MLNFRVGQILREKGIKSRYKYLIKAGFNYDAAYKLLKGKRESITLHQLENLCLMLKCNPNDLLEWHPSEKQAIDEHHPLFSLIRTRKAALAERIQNLPYEQLAALEKLLDESEQ